MRILTYTNRREQPVQKHEKGFGYFPKAFRWRGKRYDVQSIERTWARSRRAPRLYFRVHCRDEMFDLCQDLRTDTWFISALKA